MSNFEWPKPVKKKTIWVELDTSLWEEIEQIQKQNSLTQEQVFNTIINWGFGVYLLRKKADQTKLPANQQTSKPAKVTVSTPLKMTPEQTKAKKAAYARKYYQAHKKVQEQPSRQQTPVISMPEQTTTEPKPYVKTGAQLKREEAAAKNEEAVVSKVVQCALENCTGKHKFLKGMGVAYHEMWFCQDQCLEIYINTVEKKTRNRLSELEEETPASDWDGTLPGEENKLAA